jgi:hypothetical protein
MVILFWYFIKTRNIWVPYYWFFFFKNSEIQNQRLGYNTSIKTRQILEFALLKNLGLGLGLGF